MLINSDLLLQLPEFSVFPIIIDVVLQLVGARERHQKYGSTLVDLDLVDLRLTHKVPHLPLKVRDPSPRTLGDVCSWWFVRGITAWWSARWSSACWSARWSCARWSSGWSSSWRFSACVTAVAHQRQTPDPKTISFLIYTYIIFQAYMYIYTCLRLRLLFLGNNGVGGTPPPCYLGGV